MARSLACLLVLIAFFQATAADARDHRAVDIWSDGTRMSGDLWLPDGFSAAGKTPALVLAHGWGGVRSHLNQAYSPEFVDAGFIVLTFDYRGWADSDARLIPVTKPEPAEGGTVAVRAVVRRQIVDPRDQVRDIVNAISFLVGEPGVDTERLGLWGTSYAGGHVIEVAARDRRIAAVASFVGFQGHGSSPAFRAKIRRRAVEKARGQAGPLPPASDRLPGLRGITDVGGGRVAATRHWRWDGAFAICRHRLFLGSSVGRAGGC